MSALDTQVGGDHYKSAAIQPVQYIEANDLKFLEGCVVKRVTRHNKPTGKGRQDIEKAIHELQLLLELRYPVESDTEFKTHILTEDERLDIHNQLQAQARCINADPDATIIIAASRSQTDRPAWPGRTEYRYMFQNASGQWYVSHNKPEIDSDKRWLVEGSYASIDVPYPVIGDWRDTLIQRGADE